MQREFHHFLLQNTLTKCGKIHFFACDNKEVVEIWIYCFTAQACIAMMGLRVETKWDSQWFHSLFLFNIKSLQGFKKSLKWISYRFEFYSCSSGIAHVKIRVNIEFWVTFNNLATILLVLGRHSIIIPKSKIKWISLL